MDSFYLVTKLENMKISQETSIPQTPPTGHHRNYQVRKENSSKQHYTRYFCIWKIFSRSYYHSLCWKSSNLCNKDSSYKLFWSAVLFYTAVCLYSGFSTYTVHAVSKPHQHDSDKDAPSAFWQSVDKYSMLPAHLHIIWANLQSMLGQCRNDTIILIDTHHDWEHLCTLLTTCN